MTEAEARARIEDLVQWQAAPALTSAEVDRLLSRARVTDENGVEVDAVGYVETWTTASVNAAVAEGFEMKAAKVAGQYDLKAGDVDLKRSQQLDALRRQARRYSGGLGSLTMATELA